VDSSLQPLEARFGLARDRGEAVVLATVFATAGSTYRKAGAHLLIDAQGDYVGLVSGGCLEGDLALRARHVIASGEPQIVSYDMRGPDDQLWGLGAGCEGAMQLLLQRGSAVSAVVCGNDYLAAGALSALDAAQAAVPGRISVASFNNNDFAPYLHPPLTTARVPIAAIGEAAGRYLLARLAGQSPEPPGLLPVELIVRGSTGPAP
jgi:LacI family transcriptional regulator